MAKNKLAAPMVKVGRRIHTELRVEYVTIVIPHTDYPARFCEEIVHPETREVIVGAFEAVDSCALSALLDAGADTFIVEAAGIRYRLTAVDL